MTLQPPLWGGTVPQEHFSPTLPPAFARLRRGRQRSGYNSLLLARFPQHRHKALRQGDALL